jgi:hypothetical protein
MPRPIFVICQGRSGGTIVAHALAESLPNTTLLNEPLHDELAKHVEAQPKRTPAHLRHDGVTDPWRGYVGVSLQSHVGMRAPVGQKLAWLEDLVHQAPQRPVIKLLRMWGNLARLREAFPQADFIHLHREWETQWQSYSGLGFLRDYFGECRYGYKLDSDLTDALDDRDFHRLIWERAQDEGRRWADHCIALGELTEDPVQAGKIMARHFGWEGFDAERFAGFFTRRSH